MQFVTVLEAVRGLFQMSFGIYAPPIIITTTAETPCNGYCLQAIDGNVVIASITINGTAITSFSGVTLAQGQQIFGNITSVTLTSGIAMVNQGRNG
jgi:hypothetical protein